MILDIFNKIEVITAGNGTRLKEIRKSCISNNN